MFDFSISAEVQIQLILYREILLPYSLERQDPPKYVPITKYSCESIKVWSLLWHNQVFVFKLCREFDLYSRAISHILQVVDIAAILFDEL